MTRLGVIAPGLLLGLSLLAGCADQPVEAVGQPPGPTAGKPPNILMIVLDDFGYWDLGANGNPDTTTPNLDRFAAEGLRFTRNYVNASCTVTRAGILIGEQPEIHGFRPDALGISPEVTTLPEALREAGYQTHHVGKWHLGHLSRLAWPTQQGYDSFFGFLGQNLLLGKRPNGKWRVRNPTYRDPALRVNEGEPAVYEGHLTDILAGRVEETLTGLAGTDAPWFLSYWTFAPHAPVDPGGEFAARYPDTPGGRYRALVEHLDHALGTVLDSLEANGLKDETLVMIVSDNGGTSQGVESNLPFAGVKTEFLEGGVRTPLLIRWPGQVEPGQVTDALVYYLDYFPTLANVAGAHTPDTLTGLDLFEVARGTAAREQNLYWESVGAHWQSWSVLSADGRWRLYQPVFDYPALFDLVESPGGVGNVAERHPQVVDRLRSDYLDWQQANREVSLARIDFDERGHGRLEGNAFLRSPGYTGYTFGIALYPAGEDATSATGQRQTIAYQRDMWHLFIEAGQLRGRINDVVISAPAPAVTDCTTVVLTTEHKPGLINPRHSGTLLELYVDGEPVAVYDTRSFTDPAEGHTNPLFIGRDEAGAFPFRGRLGRPVILSDSLSPAGRVPLGIGRDIAAFESTLCDPA